MATLRAILILMLITIFIYTSFVIANHGMNFMPVYFSDLFSLSWTGQFVLDFSIYLLLTALWIAWRHQFSSRGIMLGALAPFGGIIYLSIYLIVVTGKPNCDMKVLLLGPTRE